jgi:predicted transcriptional regulator
MTRPLYGTATRRWASVSLGPLEFEIMSVLWRAKECTVRDLARRLRHPRAYTTVMTTADRLYFKGMLNREMVAQRFVYSPRLSFHDLEEMLDNELLQNLLGRPEGSRTAIVLSLVDAVKREYPDLYGKLKAGIVGKENRRRGGTTVNISSCPAGADIEVDGAFVGNTPSSVLIPPGEHSIKMSKSGYGCWHRALTARRGVITVTARLLRTDN